MEKILRFLSSYAVPHDFRPGMDRRFDVHAIRGLEDIAHGFINANGGADFIHRIVQSAQPDKTQGPVMRKHSKIAAIHIPVEVVKPGTKIKPRHVDDRHVHVSFQSGQDPRNDRGQNLSENARDLHRIWERMKLLSLLRVRQLRTSVPLFVVHSPEAQYMVSIESKLPTLAERLKELRKNGRGEEEQKLRKKFQQYLYTLEHEYGIKPGTTYTGDYFVHHPSGKKKTPQFLLILPHGGRLLPLKEKWRKKLVRLLNKKKNVKLAQSLENNDDVQSLDLDIFKAA